jgi:hypothetical protein
LDRPSTGDVRDDVFHRPDGSSTTCGGQMDPTSVLTLLLLGIALAVQPWSVLASLLLATSAKGLRKVSALVAGWVLALTAVAIATVVLYPEVPAAESSGPLSGVELVAGLALAGWLVRRRRSSSGRSAAQPGFMRALDSMSPGLAFALGAFLPNYVFVVAAVSEMLQAGLSQGRLGVAALGFIVVSSLGVAAPLLVRAARGERAPQIFHRWRAWLTAHGSDVGSLVLAVVAGALIVKGLVGLLA